MTLTFPTSAAIEEPDGGDVAVETGENGVSTLSDCSANRKGRPRARKYAVVVVARRLLEGYRRLLLGLLRITRRFTGSDT